MDDGRKASLDHLSVPGPRAACRPAVRKGRPPADRQSSQRAGLHGLLAVRRAPPVHGAKGAKVADCMRSALDGRRSARSGPAEHWRLGMAATGQADEQKCVCQGEGEGDVGCLRQQGQVDQQLAIAAFGPRRVLVPGGMALMN